MIEARSRSTPQARHRIVIVGGGAGGLELATTLGDALGRRGRRDGQRLHRAGSDAVGGGHVPVGGLALILGIDRFMSEARALTNLIGNGVATVVVAKWTGDLDTERMQRHLDNETAVEADEPEEVLDATEAHMPGTPATVATAR